MCAFKILQGSIDAAGVGSGVCQVVHFFEPPGCLVKPLPTAPEGMNARKRKVGRKPTIGTNEPTEGKYNKDHQKMPGQPLLKTDKKNTQADDKVYADAHPWAPKR